MNPTGRSISAAVKAAGNGSLAGPGSVCTRRHVHPTVPVTSAMSLCSFVLLLVLAVCPPLRKSRGTDTDVHLLIDGACLGSVPLSKPFMSPMLL